MANCQYYNAAADAVAVGAGGIAAVWGLLADRMYLVGVPAGVFDPASGFFEKNHHVVGHIGYR